MRSFSCIDGNENIPRVAHKHGLKTLVGTWLSNDKDENEKEIEGLIQLAQECVVDIAAIGNEVMYRNDLTLEELLDYLQRVKKALPHIPVGYVDAYYEFSRHKQLVDNCDVILSNCYPFWEGTPIEYALAHMQDMIKNVQQVSRGKKIIVSETGWPNQGEALRSSQPSDVNAMKYFIEIQKWSKKENIDMFFFSSFDESWKVEDEGDVGAYWGIWDKNEKLKYTGDNK